MKEKQRIADQLPGMLASCMKQFRLATSVQLLFVIKTDRKGNRLPAEQVTDPQGNDLFVFLGGERLDGVDDGTILSPRRSQYRYWDMLDRHL